MFCYKRYGLFKKDEKLVLWRYWYGERGISLYILTKRRIDCWFFLRGNSYDVTNKNQGHMLYFRVIFFKSSNLHEPGANLVWTLQSLMKIKNPLKLIKPTNFSPLSIECIIAQTRYFAKVYRSSSAERARSCVTDVTEVAWQNYHLVETIFADIVFFFVVHLQTSSACFHLVSVHECSFVCVLYWFLHG